MVVIKMTPELRWAIDNYYPSFPGVHVCDVDRERDCPITAANFPCQSPAQARALWESLKAEFEIRDGEPNELTVDLNDGEYHTDDFSISRQMLDRLKAAALSDGMGRAPCPTGSEAPAEHRDAQPIEIPPSPEGG